MLCQRLLTRVLQSRTFSTAPTLSYQYILTETKGEKNNVGFIKLNRAKALNALCDPLMTEMSEAIAGFDNDPKIGAVVVTGSDRAFAAGADIAEMQNMEFPEVYTKQFLSM